MYLDSIKSEIKPRTVDTYLDHGRHISNAYRDVPIDSLNGLQIRGWLNSLPLSGSQKAKVRHLFRSVVRYAMLSEKTSLQLNPLDLIKLRGTTKRQKKIVVLTPVEFIRLVRATKQPYDRVVLLCGFLGLRIGECLALKWSDFDVAAGKVAIQRSISAGHLTDAKTEASNTELPVPDSIMELVQQWKSEAISDESETVREWLFPSSRSESGILGYSGIIVQKVLHPACDAAGIPRIGFHALRHLYKSWLDVVAQ